MSNSAERARKKYPSDLSDSEWEIVKRYVPAPKPSPFPPKYQRREIVNAILYKVRTGCGWQYLPNDLPHWKTVSDYFYMWRDDGTWKRMNDGLRELTRWAEGRDPKASFGAIDSQTTKGSETSAGNGYDGGKRIKGRKRHLVVDALGLLLAVLVTSAGVSDQSMIMSLTLQAKAASSKLTGIVGDAHYRGPMADAVTAFTGVQIQSTKAPPGTGQFEPVPFRWRVERSFAWLNRNRELVGEYTTNPSNSEVWIRVAFSRLMLRRLDSTVA